MVQEEEEEEEEVYLNGFSFCSDFVNSDKPYARGGLPYETDGDARASRIGV